MQASMTAAVECKEKNITNCSQSFRQVDRYVQYCNAKTIGRRRQIPHGAWNDHPNSLSTSATANHSPSLHLQCCRREDLGVCEIRALGKPFTMGQAIMKSCS
jgi:hypothetical protein